MVFGKPSRKPSELVPLGDLAPTREIKGGNHRRVFGTTPIDEGTRRNEMKQVPKTLPTPKTKDLPPRKDIKGGRLI